MDHVCLALPIRTGRTGDARSFMRELDGARRDEFDSSERRIGITKELWFLAEGPSGDQLLGYMESADFHGAVAAFSASREPFDLWFKERMLDVTGVDFNNLPADFRPPELVSHYEAGMTV